MAGSETGLSGLLQLVGLHISKINVRKKGEEEDNDTESIKRSKSSASVG